MVLTVSMAFKKPITARELWMTTGSTVSRLVCCLKKRGGGKHRGTFNSEKCVKREREHLKTKQNSKKKVCRHAAERTNVYAMRQKRA